ncbi:MAG: adenylate/guanylate cyclase domain-containing protein [Woeseia sp.]
MVSRTRVRSADAHAEFDALVENFSRSKNSSQRLQAERALWDRFGTTGTTFISDMASFSSTSRAFGICHFLNMIHRARQIIAPRIDRHGGLLLKCDADNCYAFFESADSAIQASLDINDALFRANQDEDPQNHIFLAVGIDYGDVLLVGTDDFYGDPVNTASKLGEDLAGGSQILVTDRALEKASYQVPPHHERMVARISDIEIEYVKLQMRASV